jgi:hypothetical protein
MDSSPVSAMPTVPTHSTGDCGWSAELPSVSQYVFTDQNV